MCQFPAVQNKAIRSDISEVERKFSLMNLVVGYQNIRDIVKIF